MDRVFLFWGETVARYGKVDRRVWGDERFLSLTPIQPCGQGLWLYLLTCPESGPIPGIFRAGEAALAESLGWPLKAFREAFREASSKGMIEANWEARIVWIKNAIRYNAPESPNVVTSWKYYWDELPECELKVLAWHTLKVFLEGIGEAFGKAFEKACPKPSAKTTPKAMANQEQEQEQKQKKKQEQEEASAEQNSAPAIPQDLLGLRLYEADHLLCSRWPELKESWAVAFPGVDPAAEVRRAHAWELANPKKIKKDRPKFLNTWFSRTQDHVGMFGGNGGQPQRMTKGDKTAAAAQEVLRMMREKREQKEKLIHERDP